MLEKQQKRFRRHKRVRAKIYGTANRPRLCVFKSNKHIYAQLIIDDEKSRILVAASDHELKGERGKEKLHTLPPPSPPKAGPLGKIAMKKLKVKEEETVKTGKVAIAYEVGKLIAEKALKKKIEKAVFDRGGYKYHGNVKAIAEGAREGGLMF